MHPITDASQQRVMDLRDMARPGDVFASLGSPWSLPEYAMILERMRHEDGLRYAALVYDLIPIIRPEYCDRTLVGMFTRFIHGCLPQADTVFAISNATVHDIATWAAHEGIALRAKPQAIPIGTGFTHTAPAQSLPASLTPGGYALFVSTIEARKNHVLAFRAWRRLLQALPPDQVPTLVFAGRIGWMVEDLMRQIENAAHLNGKLAIIENPDDATLAALYTGARFTLFPSLYEGWGLPVSESLSFGKVCIASSAAAVPEAGGEFCLYHDPDSVTEATALYRRAITEPGLIEGLEARIRSEYRPVPWSSTARAVLDALG
jgi:glycosyltransferase involved in cell wall biosynthesis